MTDLHLTAGPRRRMPVVFGPTPGPRQAPDGSTFDGRGSVRETHAVGFLTDPAALEALLPPGCRLDGDPVVTVEHVVLTNLAWLAGRGYSLLNVKFPVRYEGAEHARGPFLAVLWENMAEPIMSGREELGFAKLYCELPPAEVRDDAVSLEAVWHGTRFLSMTLSGLRDATPPAAGSPIDGVIHHRYFPPLGPDGDSGIDHLAISPASAAAPAYESYQVGEGTVAFDRVSWEQLPTMFHIVNTLAAMPVIQVVSCQHHLLRGGGDLGDQRILR